MDPKKGPIVLTESQVASLRAAAQAKKGPRAPPRSQSPVGGSSDDGDPNGPKTVWSQSQGAFRRSKHWRDPSVTNVLALPAPEIEKPRQPTPVSSDTEDQGMMTEDQKRCARSGKKKTASAFQKAPAAQKPVPEAKASKPGTGQESPETKVPKPMETRRQAASRAGGLRPGGGSGQTDTCVASGNPSKT
jgi:hypothetical protein